jgi:glyoxylase-like metal-dependent hydrolase (beta-lactamase superfamily II)
MKRVLKWIGIIVAALVVIVGALGYSAFGDSSPIVAGPLAPGVETVKDEFVSVFFLDAGAGKVALIDAGNDKTGAAILAALSRRNLAPDAVSAILLTHGHPDHTAACKLFPAAAVYALDTETALIGDAAKVTHPLKDGEAFDVGELHIEVFAVPGHTPGSAVYLARNVLFFGDSAGTSAKGEMKKAVWIFTKDNAQNVASLKTLEARLAPRAPDVKQLAFAHTGPIAGFQAFASFAARH